MVVSGGRGRGAAGHPPSSSSLTSLAAFSPSSRRFLSIIFDRSAAALSSALTVQPMAPHGGAHRPLRPQILQLLPTVWTELRTSSSGVFPNESKVNVPASQVQRIHPRGARLVVGHGPCGGGFKTRSFIRPSIHQSVRQSTQPRLGLVGSASSVERLSSVSTSGLTVH